MYERHNYTTNKIENSYFHKILVQYVVVLTIYNALFSTAIRTALVVLCSESYTLAFGFAGSSLGRADFSVDLIIIYVFKAP